MRRLDIAKMRLAVLLLALGLVSACGDNAKKEEVNDTAEDTMDVSEMTDVNEDTAEDVSEDDEQEIITPDLVEDTGDEYSCAEKCVEYGDLAAMCIFGGMNAQSPFEPAPAGPRYAERSTAFELSELSPSIIALIEEKLPAGARVEVNATHGVLIVDKLDAAETRDILSGVGVVKRELPTLIMGPERVVALSQVVLGVSRDMSRADVETLAADNDMYVVRQLALPGAWLLSTADDPFVAAESIQKVSGVEFADVNFLRSYRRNNDTLYPDQWHLDNTGQNGALTGVDIMATEAWELTTGDSNVIVAVHDDGVDVDHPEFAGKIVYADGTRSTEQALRDALSGGAGSHGTAVAGVAAAAGDNMRGGRGVCPDCSVMPMLILEGQFAGSLSIDDATVADDMTTAVDAGAAVINASWGPIGGDPAIIDEPLGGTGVLANIVQMAFNYAESDGRGGLGTLIVYAAGNENQDNSNNPYVNHPTVVAVAAYDDQGLKSKYSNFGAAVDISAPSSGGVTGGIIAPLPQMGSGPVFNQLNQGGVTGPDGEPYTLSFGGTSSAAPVVTGVIGLMISVNPTITAEQIRTILADTADKLDRVNGQYDGTGHSIFYGNGGVNAYAAVLAAQDLADSCDTNRMEACNGVDDNCDGIVDENCTTVADCQPCEFDSACDSGLCVRTPGDAANYCVTESTDGTCGTGFEDVNGFCVPETTGRCGECADTESCNGVDDNCDGQIDEGDICPAAGQSCYHSAECGDNAICTASGRCSGTCETSDDCNVAGQQCAVAADRYGQPGDDGICYMNQVTQACIGFLCQQQPANSEAFFECLDATNNPDCGAVFACAFNHLDLGGIMP